MANNKETMAKNIRYHLDRLGIERQKMCDDLGFNYTTVCEWMNAHAYPRIDKIEMMANYFGISKSDLVEERKSPVDAVAEGLPEYAADLLFRVSTDVKVIRMIKHYYSLSDEKQEVLRDLISWL